jgi:hypothetical protein
MTSERSRGGKWDSLPMNRNRKHRTPNAEHRMLPLRSSGWSHSTFDVRCSVFGVFQVQGPNALPILGIDGCP